MFSSVHMVDMMYQLQSNPGLISYLIRPTATAAPPAYANHLYTQNPYLNPMMHHIQQQNILLNNPMVTATRIAQQMYQQQHTTTTTIPPSSSHISNDNRSAAAGLSTEDSSLQTSNLQPASASGTVKFSKQLKLATWNVEGCDDCSMRVEIDKILFEKRIDIACIQNTEFYEDEQLETTNYKWHFIKKLPDYRFYDGTAILVTKGRDMHVQSFEAITGNILACFLRVKEMLVLVISVHIRNKPNENRDEFYKLEKFVKKHKGNPTILLGDFSAELGLDDFHRLDGAFMGRHLFHRLTNINGRQLKTLAENGKLFIKNTFKTKYKNILTTCKSSEGESQTDHILTTRDGTIFINMIAGYHKKAIKTSHKLITASITVKSLVDEEVTQQAPTTTTTSKSSSGPEGAASSTAPTTTSATVTTSYDINGGIHINHNIAQSQLLFNVQPIPVEQLIFNSLQPTIQIEPIPPQRASHFPLTIDADDTETALINPDIDLVEMQISPGEPVPPGFENEVKPVAQIQPTLNKCRNRPLVGLEYLMELNMGERRDRTYHCALCDEIFENRTIMFHLTDYEHRVKFLEKHFPSAYHTLYEFRYKKHAERILSGVVEALCDAIEVTYGRLQPNVYENVDYYRNRATYMHKLMREKHFSEHLGADFLNVIDLRVIQRAFDESASAEKRSLQPQRSFEEMSAAEKRPASSSAYNVTPQQNDDESVVPRKIRRENSFSYDRTERISFDSLTSNESLPSFKMNEKSSFNQEANQHHDQIIVDRINLDDISSDEDPSKLSPQRIRAVKSDYIANINDDDNNRFKLERYRNLVDKAVRDLECVLDEYERYPQKHPLYPTEWNKFWERRCDELQAENKDPTTYNFSPEWTKYWLRRVREIHEEDVALKKFEIRKELNLPSDFYGRTNSTSANSNDRQDNLNGDYQGGRSSKSGGAASSTSTKGESAVEFVDENVDDEPLTIISVLRILTAFEDYLGSLGPKVIDLLSKAIALEKVKANLADDMLMTEENSVLLETIKEKLKGLVIAGIIEKFAANAVKKAIRNVTAIVNLIDKKIREEKESTLLKAKSNLVNNLQQKRINENIQSRAEISHQISIAFLLHGRNVSNEQLENLTDAYLSKEDANRDTPYLYGLSVSSSMSSPQQQQADGNRLKQDGNRSLNFQFNTFPSKQPVYSNNNFSSSNNSSCDTNIQRGVNRTSTTTAATGTGGGGASFGAHNYGGSNSNNNFSSSNNSSCDTNNQRGVNRTSTTTAATGTGGAGASFGAHNYGGSNSSSNFYNSNNSNNSSSNLGNNNMYETGNRNSNNNNNGNNFNDQKQQNANNYRQPQQQQQPPPQQSNFRFNAGGGVGSGGGGKQNHQNKLQTQARQAASLQHQRLFQNNQPNSRNNPQQNQQQHQNSNQKNPQNFKNQRNHFNKNNSNNINIMQHQQQNRKFNRNNNNNNY